MRNLVQCVVVIVQRIKNIPKNEMSKLSTMKLEMVLETCSKNLILTSVIDKNKCILKIYMIVNYQ